MSQTARDDAFSTLILDANRIYLQAVRSDFLLKYSSKMLDELNMENLIQGVVVAAGSRMGKALNISQEEVAELLDEVVDANDLLDKVVEEEQRAPVKAQAAREQAEADAAAAAELPAAQEAAATADAAAATARAQAEAAEERATRTQQELDAAREDAAAQARVQAAQTAALQDQIADMQAALVQLQQQQQGQPARAEQQDEPPGQALSLEPDTSQAEETPVEQGRVATWRSYLGI